MTLKIEEINKLLKDANTPNWIGVASDKYLKIITLIEIEKALQDGVITE